MWRGFTFTEEILRLLKKSLIENFIFCTVKDISDKLFFDIISVINITVLLPQNVWNFRRHIIILVDFILFSFSYTILVFPFPCFFSILGGVKILSNKIFSISINPDRIHLFKNKQLGSGSNPHSFLYFQDF